MTDVLIEGAFAYRRFDGQIFRRPLETKNLSAVEGSWKALNDLERRVTPTHIIEQLSQSPERRPLQFD